ncbi:MAG: hypothetical protein ACYDHY_14095 [Acidiferrobacterales bacterium]|nr:hypothetical protein [Betaproteobacteria bacterium]
MTKLTRAATSAAMVGWSDFLSVVFPSHRVTIHGRGPHEPAKRPIVQSISETMFLKSSNFDWRQYS